MFKILAVILVMMGGVYINPSQIIYLDWKGEYSRRLVYGVVGNGWSTNNILVNKNCHVVAQLINNNGR